MSASPTSLPLSATRERHWSDLTGAAAFLAIAAYAAATAPSLSIALLPVLAYEVFSAVAFLVRGRARSTLPGLAPRAAAYAGTFLVPVFLVAAATWAPAWLTPVTVVAPPKVAASAVAVGLYFRVIGIALSFWGLWNLRFALSLVPAARQLVTGGAYAFARHPLYAGYAATYLGILIHSPTLPLFLVVVAWFGFTRVRMRYEEGVLTTVFPEYAAYRQRVGAFGPTFRRRAA